jgi:serine/threonine-protein kinase RsbW
MKMKIQLRGYLTFKGLVGDRKFEIPDGLSVRQFLSRLSEVNGEFGSLIQFDRDGSLAQIVIVLVNGRNANHLPGGLDAPLKDGDEVAIFPPIAGGSRKDGFGDMNFSMNTPAKLKNLESIRAFIQFAAREFGADRDASADIMLAVDEAASNIILHGYSLAQGMLELKIECQEGILIVLLKDWAPPFDPTTAAPPDLDLPLDKRPLGGLGIHLIRQMTDRIEYERTPDGANILSLYKTACKKITLDRGELPTTKTG